MKGVAATTYMTAEEFLALPWEPDRRRSQLIDGELVMNEPNPRHNHSQKIIIVALQNWAVGPRGRGTVYVPLDIRLNERNVYAPDVAWYRDDRAPGLDDRPPFPMPDLAVEVRSPSSWRRDVGIKKPNYERHGVGELWLIDNVALVVHVLRRSALGAPRFDVSNDLHPGETLTSPMLPGFELAVEEILGLG